MFKRSSIGGMPDNSSSPVSVAYLHRRDSDPTIIPVNHRHFLRPIVILIAKNCARYRHVMQRFASENFFF